MPLPPSPFLPEPKLQLAASRTHASMLMTVLRFTHDELAASLGCGLFFVWGGAVRLPEIWNLLTGNY